ncbi:MAG: helix-turn-helix domain-containing protein [Gammaproteobacteria bacterium]|nr:helix-turn-helix domain-containing protein [Gammaproteobacteria bacterium]MBU1409417.1 helix-turn-helix domain-containing protein [Gammaproteobacteria bacterium]MBU1530599.1 helix-turn-helix domain-containing protein [Gammaproteobacteria bacterium]
MSVSVFKSIKRGLNEAVADAKGKRAGVNQYQPYEVDVAGLRKRLGLTQEQFAARFGCSIATLRSWERGDRIPRGPALVLLNVIDREPKAVMRALAA